MQSGSIGIVKRIPLRIGVSSCLLGINTRYDGGNRRDAYLVRCFPEGTEFVGLCPEIEAGLNVPRAPMRLVRIGDGIRLCVVADGKDMTERMMCAIQRMIEAGLLLGLDGLVMKARSPSCGLNDAALVSPEGILLGMTSGIFIALCRRHLPQLPIISDEGLRNPVILADFQRQFLPR